MKCPTLSTRVRRSARTLVCSLLLWSSIASSATAGDQVYFSAVHNVTQQLVQKINAERVRIDMSAWYLTERAVTSALVNRFKAGVPVRLLGDRGSIFEIDAITRREFYWLASQGVPIRLRYNPTWYPEIDHWKATIFVGQNLVAFGSANYTPFELAPISATNYKDEVVLFADTPSLVGAFKTKFDRMWNDTTPDPLSLVAKPPYFRNWNDACALESACKDYTTLYPTRAPMTINTARLEPDYPLPADLIWGQGPSFNNRLVQEINAESREVNLVSYRLTVDNITTALLTKFKSGVPTRIIMEPSEYLNRKWPEFWLTHANMDKLWAAGMPIKQRTHAGLTHMKTLITSRYATVASSNFAAAWQRDHNFFVSASGFPTVYGQIKARFETMWNDAAGFAPFVPRAADAPVLATPASGATGLAGTTRLVWNRAAFAVSYDIYLGTSQAGMTRVANVPAQLVNNPPTTYLWTPSPSLQPGTTYFWKVVSRTNATAVNPSLVAASAVWSFSTAGGAPPPPPPPPPPGAINVVIYASDVPARFGSWNVVSSPSSPFGVKLTTPDNGVAITANALAAPTHFIEVPFTAPANVPFKIWMRLRALNNSKYNDSLWLQFSDARVGGAPAYPIGSTSALLVNLATDSTGASINGWGWHNAAYWLSQPLVVTFANSGTHTIRIQVREDGVEWDQIVLSPSTYMNSAPGPVAFDQTIVPKP